MTNPSLTYGHGYLDDCSSADPTAYYAETETNCTGAPTTEGGDFLKIEVDFNDGGDENVKYRKAGLNVDSGTYTKFLLAYKTTDLTCGAKVCVNGTFTEWLLGSATEPAFSTTTNVWTLVSGTLTTGNTITSLDFYADDWPNTTAAGTHYVWYDFALLHKGTQVFPHCDVIMPEIENRYVDIEVPGRVGDITQYMGMKSIPITIKGKLDIGTSTEWGTPPLRYLYMVMQEARSDPWQWLSTGLISDSNRLICFKVTPRKFSPHMHSEATRDWSLELKTFSLSSGAESEWDNLQWYGI